MRTPKSLVNQDAEDLLFGAGMGDNAKGFRVSESSSKVTWSTMERAVAAVPPDMDPLDKLADAFRPKDVMSNKVVPV